MITIHQGIDLVDVSKLERIMTRHRGLLDEIFTEEERAYCLTQKHPFLHFAGRFAAKEACLKALGLGLSAGIDATLRDVAVKAHRSGRPELAPRGWVATMGHRKRIRQWGLSISHTEQFAVATVTLVAGESAEFERTESR